LNQRLTIIQQKFVHYRVGISGTALIRGNHHSAPLPNTRAANVLIIPVIFDTLRVFGRSIGLRFW
jgi:hypothetical protein